MNKTNLKRYAPQARKDVIAAVTARAQLLGLSEVAGQPYAEPCEVNGDVAVIAGRAWPASVQGKRERLLQRMKRDGYAATLDAVAYTWFNRFAALRYMELHDYLGHGRRVLSNPDGALPEILNHALELAEAGDLPGMRAEQVRQLKLDNQDGELFRRVLIAQCNALHGAMPFLFEAIDDETELLLPDNLLLSDSVVAKLVSEIPEEDWTEVEAIGWLYQFYISEKKDEVIGKVVKSEDIPAATQLFTPNWIVQYLVQNSVGRLWLMANPTSTLVSQWPYYIQPAEQTPEVQAQLDALIQTRIREDGEALNPETITVLDPACGSGHILVVAYDILKAIYLERGYQPRAIPRLILEKNLYGLDIDDRAAQLAAFALLMKARADDRRLFTTTDDSGKLKPPKLNVLSIRDSKGLLLDDLLICLEQFGIKREPLNTLLETFKNAKTLGSLIKIPEELSGHIESVISGLRHALQEGDLYARQAANDVFPLALQALLQIRRFDAVVANPPYMGGKGMNPMVKDYAKKFYPNGKSDLFAAFIERAFEWCKNSGFNSMVTMQSWMFLSSYEALRLSVIDERTLSTLVHIGYNSFPELNSKIVQACGFVIFAKKLRGFVGSYVNLNSAPQSADKGDVFLHDASYLAHAVDQDRFRVIPGSPLAYWASDNFLKTFEGDSIERITISDGQNKTGDNGRFVREFWEVSNQTIGRGRRWIFYAKGGGFRRWAGNISSVVDWSSEARAHYKKDHVCRIIPEYLWYKKGVTWGLITSFQPSFRLLPADSTFDVGGSSIFLKNDDDIYLILGLLNSKFAARVFEFTNPTLNFQVKNIRDVPFVDLPRDGVFCRNAQRAVAISEADWNNAETSFGFRVNRIVSNVWGSKSLAASWECWSVECDSHREELKLIEEENNRILISTLGLKSELTPEVTANQIALFAGSRESDSKHVISYAIGCMMGRYSLDEPGLIYADGSNVGFNEARYEKKFPADADGILPIMNENWFEDDAASRLREFLLAVWGQETLEENMAWLAQSLGNMDGQEPDEFIRHYLADSFYKDHLQTYKKRPIYWLFSSGKQGAFQALVYLHRYHEGTLARMRSEYVLPLTGKMQARMESIEVDIRQASSTAARNKLTKQLDALRKQHHELLVYDEKLRHYADQRITIDLDDGVKVNYGKFGDLLADVKAVTGGAGDD